MDEIGAGDPGHLAGEWEIIVVDDGSPDATASVARARSEDPRVKVVSLTENRGKGAALVEGAGRATYPWTLFLDADLPVPVESLPNVLAAGHDADLVLGSRRFDGATVNPPQPLPRRLGGAAFRMAITALGYPITTDPQCGIKLLRTRTLAPILEAITCAGFAFDVELIERARRAGLVVVEVPVTWRHVPGSSLRPVRDAVATFVELAQLRGRLEPAAVTVS